MPDGAARPKVTYKRTSSKPVTDRAGNQAKAGGFTGTKPFDAVPPDTSIITGPLNTTSSRDATLTYASEPAATFQCKIDTEPFAACPAVGKSYTSLLDGQRAFQVRAVDRAGNVDPTPATRSWTVDATPPDTTILTGPTGTVTGRGVALTSPPSRPRPSSARWTPQSSSRARPPARAMRACSTAPTRSRCGRSTRSAIQTPHPPCGYGRPTGTVTARSLRPTARPTTRRSIPGRPTHPTPAFWTTTATGSTVTRRRRCSSRSSGRTWAVPAARSSRPAERSTSRSPVPPPSGGPMYTSRPGRTPAASPSSTASSSTAATRPPGRARTRTRSRSTAGSMRRSANT